MRKETKHPAAASRVAILLTCVSLVLIGAGRPARTQTSTPPWAQGGANISNTNPGNVGIGTANPQALLTVHKDQTVGTEIRVRNDNTTSGFSGIYLNSGFTHTRGGFVQWNNSAESNNLFVATGGSHPLYLGTENSIRLTVLPISGNVGIGTTAPSEKLHVAGNGQFTGNLTVDGNISAKYQDVAEWVPSTQMLSAGTVVALDVARSNHVVASSKSYDTSVAGVVSAAPGIILGEGGGGRLKIATTGRVKIRVDATRAPIAVGDLLVTSDAEGVAMKSVPLDLGGTRIHRPGTIIGKALEPLGKGAGEILVLLSLQ